MCVCAWMRSRRMIFQAWKPPRERRQLSAGVCGWLLTYPAINCSLYRSVSIDFLLTFSLSSEDELKLSLNITAVELTLDETSFLQSVDGEKEASPACFDHLFYLRSIIQLLTLSSIVLFRRFLMTVAWTPNDYHFMATRICIQLDTGHKAATRKGESLVLPSWQV